MIYRQISLHPTQSKPKPGQVSIQREDLFYIFVFIWIATGYRSATIKLQQLYNNINHALMSSVGAKQPLLGILGIHSVTLLA